ncbi:MAG: DNA mismatch repair protein MutT [Brevundimonas sp. 32-68-21]|jgi:8-oxo-dGTP pyrophosphatase MutT (NUDIX family)|uniref:NUDIX hydrolase n=1 Tax=Brevundimonas mediterranea TaxID=74329 RepID=A0AB37E3J4_9CAUL|nr:MULTISPECIES: NUDIX hydrolase [Brevundimonas]MDZ4322442.1 NUDIX hydrolase [Phenylobacterium sp.]OGN51018.1 MAG: DNA mismatch repair protein MutT [Caulobacterales bacterium RIFCSPHIGHO2_01_FULL_67_30]OYX75845.1 MAG: DNA mismatch repair protein MutT [Brevundimonas sp. 32-68-21]PZO03251.1 MAG: NUDIX hydrolase [Alphaproteobacteria bacterium]EDX81656.1 hydrolase, NUDIX family protein [Brevundimonas sp. BAL3]
MSNSDEPKWAEGLVKPPAWRSDGTEVLFDSPWLSLTRHPATAPTGHAADYAVVRFKNVGTGVLPVHDDGTVVLVGQQRFALANYSWEMPEGGAPLDEDPFDGVRRELAEEAGLEAAHWAPALTVEMSNSITDEIGKTWIAWGLSPAPVAPDPTEIIAVVRVPFLDLLDEIGRGTVRDSLTVATAYKAYHMAQNGALPPALAQAMLGRV